MGAASDGSHFHWCHIENNVQCHTVITYMMTFHAWFLTLEHNVTKISPEVKIYLFPVCEVLTSHALTLTWVLQAQIVTYLGLKWTSHVLHIISYFQFYTLSLVCTCMHITLQCCCSKASVNPARGASTLFVKLQSRLCSPDAQKPPQTADRGTQKPRQQWQVTAQISQCHFVTTHTHTQLALSVWGHNSGSIGIIW